LATGSERESCVGDYLDPGDLPPADQQGTDKAFDGDDRNMLYTSLYHLAYEHYTIFPICLCWAILIPEMTKGDIVSSKPPFSHPIRNLTTRQYVQEGALMSGISLGHILLLRICWSSNYSTSIKRGSYLTRGEWDSHQFDIVPASALEELQVSGWEDDTESAWNEVDFVWTNEFGEDWQCDSVVCFCLCLCFCFCFCFCFCVRVCLYVHVCIYICMWQRCLADVCFSVRWAANHIGKRAQRTHKTPSASEDLFLLLLPMFDILVQRTTS
jgi:hypothetical protein